MKKNYSKPELDVTSFEVADVITASAPQLVYPEGSADKTTVVDYTAIFGV